MPKLHLLVGNSKQGNYEAYLIAGFDKAKWPEISSIVNGLPGVVQDFVVPPETLIMMAIQGLFDIASNATDKSVDELYGKK